MLPTAFDFPEEKSRLCFGIEDPKVFLRVAPTMHSFYPSKPGTVVGRGVGGGGGKSISTILWEGVFEDFFGGDS